MTDTANFVEFIVYSFHNNYDPFFILDGTPVTLKFRDKDRLCIGLPSSLNGNSRIAEMVKDGAENDTSALLTIREDDATAIRLNAIAHIDNGEKPLVTNAADVIIEPSAVSFYCLGPAK